MTPRFTILEEKVIKSFGIVFGETLLPSLRFLSICSTSYFRFGQAVNHPIFTISNYIFNYVHHLPSNKFNQVYFPMTQYTNIRSFSSYWRYPARINGSGDTVRFLFILLSITLYSWCNIMDRKLSKVREKRMIESELRRIDLVVVREENSPRDKTHYGRFRPRNVVERCVTRRCVIRRLSCALSNEFRLERSGSNVKSRMWRR